MATTESKLENIKFKPGFNRESTQYSEEGAWYDGDRVRFREGKPENLRGYQKNITTTFNGIGRDLLTWVNNNTQKLISVATEKKLYVVQSEELYDITPVVTIVSIGDVGTRGKLSTAVGSSRIECSLNAHGTSIGDFVVWSSTSINGFTTDGLDFSVTAFGGPDFAVVSVPNPEHFFISTTSVATSTETDKGHATAFFLLDTGDSDNIQGLGFGAGVYNAGVTTGTGRAFNTAASSSDITFLATQWSLDNWGEDLLAVRRGGPMYFWDQDGGTSPTRATITTSPSQINSIVVSPNDRHVVALGTTEAATSVFDPMLVRWSTQNDYNTWVPALTNTAGEKKLTDGTRIVGGIRTRNAIHIWTDNSMHALQFVGPPFTFKPTPLGSKCGLIGPHAAIDIDGATFWMGDDNFYMFDGGVRKLQCPIRRYLYDSFNTAQKEKVYAGINSEFQEVIWLYPLEGSTEPNAYVIYNYEEKHWVYGTCNFTTFNDNEVYSNTITTGEVSVGEGQFIWDNEPKDIFTGDSKLIPSRLQSADFDISEGDVLMYSDKVIPDFTFNTGSLTFTLKTKQYPTGTATTKGPYTIDEGTKKVDYRMRGRQANITIECCVTGTSWKYGSFRMALRPDGKR
jgi:hypothetical protein